ncbi:MAG: DUF302 domain-containing protein [Rhizobiaceae bacterium]
MSLKLAMAAALAVTFASTVFAADGWITKKSNHDVATTADNLVAAAEGAGATVFARVDHQKGATSIGSEIAGATLVIFGNPKIGTPIIAENPEAGLDLPIRVLIWDDGGQTMIGYLSPDELADRYGLSESAGALKTMGGAAGKLTDKAAN